MSKEMEMSDAVSLARLEGKIDVLNERQQNMTANWQLANERLNAHSQRLTVLEQKDTLDVGKEQGVAQVVKVGWAILAVLLTGGISTLATIIWAVGRAFNG